jgi:hypothetical protein
VAALNSKIIKNKVLTSVSLEGSVEYLMIYLVTGLSLDSSSPGEVKVIVALSQLNKT